MSGKAIVEVVKNSMVQSIRAIERDYREVNQLQNAVRGGNWRFAISACRASFRSMRKGLENVASSYGFVVPEWFNVLVDKRNSFVPYEYVLGDLNRPEMGRKAFAAQSGSGAGVDASVGTGVGAGVRPESDARLGSSVSDDTLANANEEVAASDTTSGAAGDASAVAGSDEFAGSSGEFDEPMAPIVPVCGSYDNVVSEGAFVVNPLSGIGNFARGLPFLSLSVGILASGQEGEGRKRLETSVVYDFFGSCFYTANDGHGAFLNIGYDVKLSPSQNADIKAATIFSVISSSPANSFDKFAATEERKRFITKLMQSSLMAFSSVSMNNAELGIVYVASGKCDLFCYAGKVDVGAVCNAIKIATEAGAVLLNHRGDEIEVANLSSMEHGFFVSSKRMAPFVASFFV